MKRKVQENYLDFVPSRNEAYRWEQNEKNEITLFVENRGMFHWLAQKLLKKPRTTQVHLEEFGSFLWPLMDGERTVWELGEAVRKQFGEKAEPLYPRLVAYIRSLEGAGFVVLTLPEK